MLVVASKMATRCFIVGRVCDAGRLFISFELPMTNVRQRHDSSDTQAHPRHHVMKAADIEAPR